MADYIFEAFGARKNQVQSYLNGEWDEAKKWAQPPPTNMIMYEYGGGDDQIMQTPLPITSLPTKVNADRRRSSDLRFSALFSDFADVDALDFLEDNDDERGLVVEQPMNLPGLQPHKV